MFSCKQNTVSFVVQNVRAGKKTLLEKEGFSDFLFSSLLTLKDKVSEFNLKKNKGEEDN